MNALSTSRIFSFNLEPIFKSYNDVAVYLVSPNQEDVINAYDSTVKAKLKDLQYEIGNLNDSPWKASCLDEETRNTVDGILGMKTMLETRELIEVFHTFHMMYVDNYGCFHNMPTKDVW
jgi:hypothetical protein